MNMSMSKRYRVNGKEYESKITIKTDEEFELFKKLWDSDSMEIIVDKTNPDWRVIYYHAGGYYAERVSAKIQALRRKRGMYHTWTVDDIVDADFKLRRLLDEIDYDNIEKQDIRNICHHINRLSNYVESIII